MKNFEDLGNLNINSSLYKTRLTEKFLKHKPYKPADPRLILSFIPGTIDEVLVEPGQIVSKGDVMIILDAMKMKNQIKCKIDGVVKGVMVNKGDRVAIETLLLEME